MSARRWILSGIVAGMFVGWTAAEGAAVLAAGPGAASQRGMPMHRGPLEFEQTALSVTDVEGGVALAFETSSGEVAELRERVRFMAEMIHMSRPPAGRPGRGRTMPMGPGMLPRATAAVEETPGGARLILQPAAGEDLDSLRQQVRQMAGRLEATGSTTMAGMMMAGPMHLEGVTLTTADVPGGVAVTFTTEADNVADLQSRVERMAAMFEAPTRGPGRGRGSAMGRGMMLAATASVERLPDGARLTLEAADASDLDALRRHVDHMIDMMNR